VAEQDQRRAGLLGAGDGGERGHVVHQALEAAGAEVAEPVDLGGGAVAAVVLAVDGITRRREPVREAGVAAEVLAGAVGDLDDAARGAGRWQAVGREAGAVGGVEVEAVEAVEAVEGDQERCLR
jgi:hypothetical protein